MNKLQYTINIAKSLPKPLRNRHNIVCIAWLKKVPFTVAVNSYSITHPLQKLYGKNSNSIFIHAEIAALISCRNLTSKEKFDKLEFTIARVTRDLTPASAKPCKGCFKALISHGVKKISWT